MRNYAGEGFEPMFHLNIPRDKLEDVYRVLTGDYQVVHKSVAHVPNTKAVAALEANGPGDVETVAEAPVEEKPKRGRKPKAAAEPAPEPQVEEEAAPEPEAEVDNAVVEAALASLNAPDPAAEPETEETWDVEEEAEVVIPAREWTDADLGALCSRVAGILKGPEKVKEKIGQFVPAGEAVVHSRNIPATDREAFYQELRKLAQAVDPAFEYEG